MELTLYTQNNALDYVQFFDFTTEELDEITYLAENAIKDLSKTFDRLTKQSIINQLIAANFAYDENENSLYAPLRFTFETPSFITDSFVLDKSNINDFVENWKVYSSVLKERDKNNIINQKIQEFYQWNEHINDEAYTENCKELDSLCSTRKRKNRKKPSR